MKSDKFSKKLPALFLCQLLFFTIETSLIYGSTTIYVTDNDGSNSGSLNVALQNVVVDNTIIDCSMIAGQTILLSTPLPAIGKNSSALTILGYGVTIDGDSAHPVFALGQGSATISDFTLQNGLSKGGSGRFGITGGGGGTVGDLIIASAGTLSGNATVNGNITSSGQISPGNSIGTINTTNLILNSTSVYNLGTRCWTRCCAPFLEINLDVKLDFVHF